MIKAAWCVVFILFIVVAGPVRAAEAADVEINVTADVIQRFLDAAAPYTVSYDLLPGAKAVQITLTEPQVVLEPGDPGRIWVEFAYTAASPLLGLEANEGRAKPELIAEFLPQRDAIKASLTDLTIHLGEKFKLKLDTLIDPLYLPIVPAEPLEMEKAHIHFNAPKAAVTVTESGLKITADYRFKRAQKEDGTQK